MQKVSSTIQLVQIGCDKAFTPSNYREILDRTNKVGFTQLLPEYVKFRESLNGIFERKIFDRSMTLEISPKSVELFEKSLIEQKLILVSRRLLTEAAALGCVTVFRDKCPNVRALETKDPGAKKYTNIFIVNKGSNLQFQTTAQKVSGFIYQLTFPNLCFQCS